VTEERTNHISIAYTSFINKSHYHSRYFRCGSVSFFSLWDISIGSDVGGWILITYGNNVCISRHCFVRVRVDEKYMFVWKSTSTYTSTCEDYESSPLRNQTVYNWSRILGYNCLFGRFDITAMLRKHDMTSLVHTDKIWVYYE